MQLNFAGSTLSWSHRDRLLVVDVHAPEGPPTTPDGPLVEWEALARYLDAGADHAERLVLTGARGIDAGLCWSSLSGHAAGKWAHLPGFVSRLGAASAQARLAARVGDVRRAVGVFGGPSIAVLTGPCARGGAELVGAVDRVVAERRPGLEDRLRAAGIAVDRWVDPGRGLDEAAGIYRSGGRVQASRQSM